MTAPLTIKDLNCSNCPSCDKNTGTWDYCNEGDFAIEPLYVKRTIELVGCCLHPLALHVLAAPVIAELKTLSKAKWDTSIKLHNASFSYEAIGIDEAITLLRGDH